MEIRERELILTIDEAQDVAESFVTGFFSARREGYPGKAGLVPTRPVLRTSRTA